MDDPRKRILVADDDTFTRFMMRTIGTTLGVDIDFTPCGAECLDRYSANPSAYGVVLMDIDIDGMSGPDTTRSIRAIPNIASDGVPIIAVTANERYLSKSVIEELGMNGFIRKPLTPGELMALVDRYC